jgi:lipopolysaccharide transport system ATP-binding protein
VKTGAVSLRQVGKAYRRYPSRWARLSEWVWARRSVRHEEWWAVRDVSLDVAPGEAVAFVGRNGAGKSTLLKLIAGTTAGTTGTLQRSGRVTALLELGLGFHPEFTGRENATTACYLMGFDEQRTRALLPEIVAFAEIPGYIDQPLRTYSTGMQMRLAFSTVTALRPDILIVDESLSVGDAYFQHKSVSRIRSFLDQGTTLLLVSHDPGVVKSLCRRALLMDEGRIVLDGEPSPVLDHYNALIARREDREIRQVETTYGRKATRSGNGRIAIEHVGLYDTEGRSVRTVQSGALVEIRCRMVFRERLAAPTVGINIRDRLGNEIFGTNTHHMHLRPPDRPFEAGARLEAAFRMRLVLGAGSYSGSVALHVGDAHTIESYDWWDQAVVFQVLPRDGYFFVGVVALDLEARLTPCPAPTDAHPERRLEP